MEDSSVEPSEGFPRLLEQLGSELVRCPACGDHRLKISIYLTEVRFFGKVVIEAGKCSSCGFTYRDVYVAEYGEPKRFEVEVPPGRAGDYLLIKSSTATVIIPELGVEITPGPAAQGYITTARGILENVRDLLNWLCQESDEECSKRLNEVSRALNGETGFTLIIEDPLGKSAVVKLP